MGIMRYNYRSEVLSLCLDITITYPSGMYTCLNATSKRPTVGVHRGPPKLEYKPNMKFQTVWLLHGGGDDDTTLSRLTRFEEYAERNHVMTVNAQVKNSFFLDTANGYKYFTFMTEELPAVVRTLFASSPKREDNFVVGMAMGGNAALYLAMRRPDLYSACVGLSGGIGCTVNSDYFVESLSGKDRPVMGIMRGVFGEADKLRDGEYDLGFYARRNKAEGIETPKLFMGVGHEDYVRNRVRVDRDALIDLGYDLTYYEAPGVGHDWDFWDLAMKKVFYEWLPLKRAPIYD